MWAIRKDKLIAIFCIVMFGLTGVAMAQEKITDASLTGLISEGKAYLEKGDLSNAGNNTGSIRNQGALKKITHKIDKIE